MPPERHSPVGLPRLDLLVPARWEAVGIAASAQLAIGIPFVAFANLVLPGGYAIPGTQIHLAARQRLEDVPLLAGLVVAEF